MPQLSFRSLPWSRPQPASAASAGRSLSFLLAESVAAILRPHLHAALAAYPVRDRARVLAAYGIGCSILADLMSQNIAMSGWQDAGVEAMKTLISGCDPEELPAIPVLPEESAWLKRNFENTPAYLEVCQMFEAAVGEIHHSRLSAKGSINTKAAMARLEAMTMNVAAFVELAA
jgi:hypothetical protein